MADELPLRTRWVDYKEHDYDAYVCPRHKASKTRRKLITDGIKPCSAHIEPLWHAWISYAVDKPPTEEPLAKVTRSWAKPHHIPNYTLTRGAYRPYNTYVPSHSAEYSGEGS